MKQGRCVFRRSAVLFCAAMWAVMWGAMWAAPPAYADEIYQWQDASGARHFGGQASAPEQAKPLKTRTPISVVVVKKVPALYSQGEQGAASSSVGGASKKTKNKRQKKQKIDDDLSVGEGAVPVEDRARHRAYCDHWRERLYRSRLGLRDHEGQSAYERECILKVHW